MRLRLEKDVGRRVRRVRSDWVGLSRIGLDRELDGSQGNNVGPADCLKLLGISQKQDLISVSSYHE